MSSLPASYFKRTASTCKVNDGFIEKNPNVRTTEIKDLGQSYRERLRYANSFIPETGGFLFVCLFFSTYDEEMGGNWKEWFSKGYKHEAVLSNASQTFQKRGC